MKDLETLLSELAEDAEEAIINPATKERLKAQGVRFNDPPKRTLEESINILFEKRKEKALEFAIRLPEPPEIGSSAIEALYNEIRESIILGLNGAAITLCGVLVEFVLKYATYKIEMGGFAKYDAEKWDEFESITFAPAIRRAAKAGLLDGENVKKLESFKDTYRNPYNHYNIKKITQTCVFEGVKQLNVNTHEVEILDIAAKDNPIFQATAKRLVDAASVFDVFAFADSVVRVVLRKTNALLQESNSDEAQV